MVLAALASAIAISLAAALLWLRPQPADSPALAMDPPAIAAREFLTAVKRKDCERAWSYFSTASQAHISRESENRIRIEPYYAESFAPKNLYCRPTYAHRFDRYDPGSVRMLSGDSARATVRVDRHADAGFRMPGFFPTRTEIHAEELELVQEAGAWRIEIPEQELLQVGKSRR